MSRLLCWLRALMAKLHGPPKAITVAPPAVRLIPKQPAQLTATITNAKGDSMPLTATSWASDNPSVATVDQAGVVTAVAPGSAGVTALFNSLVSNVCAVTVVADTTPAAVHLSPSSLSLSVGQTQQLSATVVNKAGDPL